MPNLWIKLDTVAQLRQSSGRQTPDPVTVAALAELAGADGITLHLHAERSAVTLRDLKLLKETLEVPLNVEMPMTKRHQEIAYDIRPQQATIVAEPVDFAADRAPIQIRDMKDQLSDWIRHLRDGEIEPWIYIPADLESVKAAHRLDAFGIELDTVPISYAKDQTERNQMIGQIMAAARLSQKLGIPTRIGGALDYRNIRQLIDIPVESYSVGQSVVARSLLVGVDRAVREMIDIIRHGHSHL